MILHLVTKAQFVMEALSGYVFDEEVRGERERRALQYMSSSEAHKYKGIWPQGIGSVVRISYLSTL